MKLFEENRMVLAQQRLVIVVCSFYLVKGGVRWEVIKIGQVDVVKRTHPLTTRFTSTQPNHTAR